MIIIDCVKYLLLSIILGFMSCSPMEEVSNELELLKAEFTYYAFPDVCAVNKDSLALVFYSGFGHVSNPLSTSKVTERGGKILITYSKDKGRSWAYPEVLIDTEADDRDPSISIDSNGRMYVVFFKRKLLNGKPYIDGTFFIFSDDFGHSWSDVKMIHEGYAVSSPIRELKSKELILPLYASKTRFEEQHVVITKSTNSGNTWSNPTRIFSDSDSLFNEADISEIGQNTLLASMRPANLDMEMEYSVSYDDGKSWEKSLPFGHQGISPYFFSSENLILYSYANVRGVNLAIIDTENIGSIGSAYVVDENGNKYPSITQIDENEFLVVYYNDIAIAPYSFLKGRYFKVENGKISMLSNPFPIILPTSNR